MNSLTDLRKKKVNIDPAIPEDIRMAKTTINFYKVNPDDPERMNELKRINDFINSAQDSLLDLAEEQGKEYRSKWIGKLTKASRGEKIYDLQKKNLNSLLAHLPDFQWLELHSRNQSTEEMTSRNSRIS